MSVKTNTQEETQWSSQKVDLSIIDQAGESKNLNNTNLRSFDSLESTPALVCFSHLRWDFVYQRPQHLFSRFSKRLPVYFIEEPLFDTPDGNDFLSVSSRGENITIVVPHLVPGRGFHQVEEAQNYLINKFLEENHLNNFIAWYYTPMALGFTNNLKPALTVFDCMDELSAFAGAPPELLERESRLIGQADLLFTGGYSLYEAKKHLHENAHPFPSSIELEHFKQARDVTADPEDQRNIPSPRIGFFGVIDERMDINLIGEVARIKPEWQFVFLGPVVKIDPASLPQTDNVHYLGMKSYKELPSYISGWDVAILPFALNESTRFISPTKTPEYLAAGIPVVSSAIKDVVESYGKDGLVNIYHNSADFIDAVENSLKQGKSKEWLASVDKELANNSWDLTFNKMMHLMATILFTRNGKN